MTETVSEVYQDIQSKISALQDQLLTQNPALPTLLRTIWSHLKNDPACVTLLSEEEMNIIVCGLEKQTNTFLAASISKPKASTSKALSKVKMGDLF